MFLFSSDIVWGGVGGGILGSYETPHFDEKSRYILHRRQWLSKEGPPNTCAKFQGLTLKNGVYIWTFVRLSAKITAWHRNYSAFDPSLEYPEDNMVLFWQPRPFFRRGPIRRLSSTACSCAGHYMMAKKARRFEDHREVELIMSSPDPNTHKRKG